jgi:translocator protein
MNFNISYLLVLVPNIISLIVSQIYRSEWNDKTYRNMVKPKLNPPSYVFGIVWPILYLLIGISYYIALYNKKNFKYFILPIIALIFNYTYIPLLSSENKLLLGFISIIFILLSAILVCIQFYITEKNKLSVYLLIPYILWLCFATYLSYNIYILNKDKDKKYISLI